ncbi:hypothetical protein [Comamonas terrigena]|uniref:hypothetical protein n=1 Tax=Comamonas terrigena TaxID=32013 RepID=UPI001D0F04E5|nr:hypothetical protein [Comamonas terrigena]
MALADCRLLAPGHAKEGAGLFLAVKISNWLEAAVNLRLTESWPKRYRPSPDA